MGKGQDRLRYVFGKNVRRRRRDLDLSQEALADLAGVHRTFVSSVERGERNVSIDNIEKIATALGSAPEALLARSKPEPK
jgi:transcriptional regulator with XRE-family HTH domain